SATTAWASIPVPTVHVKTATGTVSPECASASNASPDVSTSSPSSDAALLCPRRRRVWWPMPDDPIRLVIVDDHPVVRDGLRGMFASTPEFEVVGDARDGNEALTVIEQLDPDVVLMDLRMPGVGGVAAIEELTRRGARCHVLVLTTYDTDRD